MVNNEVLWGGVCFTLTVVEILLCKGSVSNFKWMNF